MINEIIESTVKVGRKKNASESSESSKNGNKYLKQQKRVTTDMNGKDIAASQSDKIRSKDGKLEPRIKNEIKEKDVSTSQTDKTRHKHLKLETCITNGIKEKDVSTSQTDKVRSKDGKLETKIADEIKGKDVATSQTDKTRNKDFKLETNTTNIKYEIKPIAGQSGVNNGLIKTEQSVLKNKTGNKPGNAKTIVNDEGATNMRRGSPSGKSMEVQRDPISAACSTLTKSMSVMQKSPLSMDRTDNRLKHTNDTLLDMRHFAERLKTFENWPVSFLKPEKLAEDGFYYLNRGDEVRCAFCKVEIMKWEPGDDPAADHRKWAPQCPFLQRQAASASNSQSPDGRDECGPADVMASRSPSVNGTTALTGAAFPEYSIMSSRFATFKHWPLSLRQKPKELADAGFFYTGQGDQTKCFYCGGGLKDWEDGDVPWEQHARWFDRCSYVRLAKGRDYIQKVMTEASMIPSTSVKNEPAKEKSSSEVPTESVTNGEVKDENICKICFVEERNVCFVPCGHVVACAKCALTTNKCPVCRKAFTDVIRMYFA